MANFTFPPLRTGVLSALVDLKQHIDSDPDAFDTAPYDVDAKKLLGKLFAPKVVEKIVEKEVIREVKAGRGRPTKDVALSEEDQETVRKSIADLLDELSSLGNGETGLDTGEKIQIIKTKANLNEQLLKMQERVFNIKKMSDFQTTILGIVDDLVPDSDKHLFMERVEPYRA